jgi:hypothetical protein
MAALTEMISFRITPADLATLRRVALMNDRPEGAEIRRALRRYVAGELASAAPLKPEEREGRRDVP